MDPYPPLTNLGSGPTDGSPWRTLVPLRVAIARVIGSIVAIAAVSAVAIVAVVNDELEWVIEDAKSLEHSLLHSTYMVEHHAREYASINVRLVIFVYGVQHYPRSGCIGWRMTKYVMR